MADWFDEPPQSSGTYTSGGSSGGSQSSGASQSTSVPTSVTSAQTDWGLMQSQLLSALADSTYNWAMNQYAKGEQVSDQTIANFMEMSGKGKGLADTLLHQYQDQIKPLMDNYIREAGSYASEGRQRFEAGKAESTVAQADKAAMDAIERKLEATGINVNSGRIQEQMIASRVADAAARAGAGTAAAQHTEDVGRQMTEKAIAMGQQLPGQSVNAIQSAYAGLTGAENAILGLLNTGKNLAEAAAPYHNAAVAANKVPPVGQQAQSTSAQESSSQQAVQQGGGSKGGGQKQQGEGGQKQPAQQRQPGAGGGAGGGSEREGPGPKLGPPVETKNYGQTIHIPQSGAATKQDDEQATGAPVEAGYAGPLGYVDDTGTIYPEFSPEAGTTTWDQALSEPEVPNWTLPEVGSRGFNTDAGSAGGDNFQLGGNAQLGTPWENALSNAAPLQGGNYSSSGVDESGFINTDYGDRLGGQNFQQFASRGDIASDATGSEAYTQEDTRGGQDFSNYGDDTGTDWGGDSGGVDESGFDNVDYSNYDYGDSSSGVDESGFDNVDYSNYDYGDSSSGVDESGFDNVDYSNYDYGDSSSGVDESGFDINYDNYDYSQDDYSDYDYSGGDYGGYEDFARGGRVSPRPAGRGVMPTTGGAVPRSASPSRGRQTDDISARLNAGEYVIPRDVVKHQGTKFFTDLIAKSRKLRTGMTGAKPGPTMRPALPQGRPTFRSRPLPPR